MVIHKDAYDKKNEEETKKPTVLISGGFDPIHIGHIRMIQEAAEYGGVVIVANSDNWLYKKKGFVFMEWERRVEILSAIKGVISVDSVDDSDGTVCEAIRRLNPTYFANGGDRGRANTPEQSVCKEMDVKLLWSIGGDEKADSSSDLAKKVRNFELPPFRSSPKPSDR